MSSRRDFLKGAVVGGVGASTAALAGVGITDRLLRQSNSTNEPTIASEEAKFQPLGEHQPGIEAGPTGFTTLLALEIKAGLSVEKMQSWMTILADDIDRLMEHRELLADPQPELSQRKDQLSIIAGFGPSLFSKLGIEHLMPKGFGELPEFKIDRLSSKESGGDVLIMISSDSSLQAAHVERTVLRDSAYFADLKWRQAGFSAIDPTSPLGSQRNLMGQIDGTGSPTPGSEAFKNSVWGASADTASKSPTWYAGGTTLVCSL